MFEKLKVEKVELVKRVIRQNNYDQYEKTFRQCSELGLNINRQALDRFANKLELIDKAQLSKRQYELHKMELAEQEEKENMGHVRSEELNAQRLLGKKKQQRQRQQRLKQQQIQQSRQNSIDSQREKDLELDAHLDSMSESLDPKLDEPLSDDVAPAPVTRERRKPQRQEPRRSSRNQPELSYEQVKQRETEITFELGEIKIRENELLQELIKLTEMLDKNQKN